MALVHHHPTNVVFAGGGSMEYLHPGVAIAAALAERVPRLHAHFWGDGRAIERQTIQSAGYRYTALPPRPKCGNSPWRSLQTHVANSAIYCAARWLVNELDASLVIGLGGSTSARAIRAARHAGIPALLVEQNAQPTPEAVHAGRRAARICLGQEEAAPYFDGQTPIAFTGTPTRPVAFDQATGEPNPNIYSAEPAHQKRTLVILGGVGGSTLLNEAMPRLLARDCRFGERWRVVHQAGQGQLAATEQRYQALGIESVVVSYIDQIAHLLSEADLVVCRPGGSTLAELSLAAIPALLLSEGSGGCLSHRANALKAELAGAARVVQASAKDLEGALAEKLYPLLWSDEERGKLSTAMGRLARPRAAELVAENCCELLGISPQQSVRRTHGYNSQTNRRAA